MLLEDLTQLEDYVLKSRDRYIHTHIHPYTPIHIHTYTHIYVHTVTRHAFMHTHHACTHHLCRPIHKGWAEYMESPGEMVAALQFFEITKDHFSVVRVLCYLGNIQKVGRG